MSILTLAEKEFTVRLNPARSIEDLIPAGRFLSAHPEITSDHFPCPVRAKAKVVIQVASVAGAHHVNADVALAWMKDNHLRPASAYELVAVAVLRPKVRILCTIWALGSLWKDADGIAHIVGCALWNDRKLRLTDVRPEPLWGRYDHFFCVSD